MILTLAFNLLLVVVAIALPNDALKWNGYLLFGLQLLTLVPYALRRGHYLAGVFVPSVFTLLYALVNLTLGGYLVPRAYGWNKEYTGVALDIGTYGVIVPYLLVCNIVVFLVACRTLRAQPAAAKPRSAVTPVPAFSWPVQLGCLIAFVTVTRLDVYSAFSFQLAIAVIHLSDAMRSRARSRLVVAAVYLVTMVAFDFGNKREIAILLFLTVFLETYYGRHVMRIGVRHLASYAVGILAFLSLILTASILRGYGSFNTTSVFGAAAAMPQYVRSDIFVDGLTDNLELNYNYGSSVTAIDLTLQGHIPYQYGNSFWKVLFLPIPRDVFPDKPESVMQIYTRVYSPQMWFNEGSLPVAVSSEMFVNFGLLGVLPLALIWLLLDMTYVGVREANPRSLRYYASLFLMITILMYARGSGLEQYGLYFLIALPALAVASYLLGTRRSFAPLPALR